MESVKRHRLWQASLKEDTFFTRVGDIVSAGLVAFGAISTLTTGAFAVVNVLLTMVWLGVARQIAREHRRREWH